MKSFVPISRGVEYAALVVYCLVLIEAVFMLAAEDKPLRYLSTEVLVRARKIDRLTAAMAISIATSAVSPYKTHLWRPYIAYTRLIINTMARRLNRIIGGRSGHTYLQR